MNWGEGESWSNELRRRRILAIHCVIFQTFVFAKYNISFQIFVFTPHSQFSGQPPGCRRECGSDHVEPEPRPAKVKLPHDFLADTPKTSDFMADTPKTSSSCKGWRGSSPASTPASPTTSRVTASATLSPSMFDVSFVFFLASIWPKTVFQTDLTAERTKSKCTEWLVSTVCESPARWVCRYIPLKYWSRVCTHIT